LAQIFHPSTNTISRVSIYGAAGMVAGLLWMLYAVDRSPYVTEEDVPREQPVPFSHAHHVGGIGLDCRYCHTAVEESPFAGIPPTQTCIHCHSQLFADSPTLEPVRESFRTDRPLLWTRVNDLPDFAYFDHSIHIHKGVGCVTCHGPVDRMALTWKGKSLQMEWCLDCHRDPEPHLRPREHVFDPDWTPEEPQEELGRRLAEAYDVHAQDNCSICHR
jgi:Cytochrome c7 and related cytochrome c